MNSTQAFLADQFIGDKPSKESKYTLLPAGLVDMLPHRTMAWVY